MEGREKRKRRVQAIGPHGTHSAYCVTVGKFCKLINEQEREGIILFGVLIEAQVRIACDVAVVSVREDNGALCPAVKITETKAEQRDPQNPI